MVETLTLQVPLWTIPSDSVGFQIFKNGKPAVGAEVTLCTKGVIPVTYTKITNSDGVAIFRDIDMRIDGVIPPDVFKGLPWLFYAYIKDSDYGIWQDEVKFEYGKLYEYNLKLYKKTPTFFIKIELKDVIMADLFSNLVAEVEKTALEWAGLKVIGITGQGTKLITIKFQLPWHSSPIVIEWAAAWFILKVLAVAGAIIAILVILKWTFGDAAAVVAETGLLLLALAAILVLAGPAKKVVEKKLEERRKR